VLRDPMGRLDVFEFCAARMSHELTCGFVLAEWPCGSLLPLREMKDLGDLESKSKASG
jgi:hypothetical protein